MKINKGIFIFAIIVILVILVNLLECFFIDKLVGPDYAIEDRLDLLKENGLILDYENFYWEYDSRSIASFAVKFTNGKIGEFDYAKLTDEKIEFERMSVYDGYAIRGYTIFKNLDGVSDVCGYRKLLNISTVEEMIENLDEVDAIINTMPILDTNYPSVYSEDFFSILPDKVHYEDDDVKIIFFRIKKTA